MNNEEGDNEQGELVIKLKGIDNAVKPAEKRYFLINVGLFLDAREKILNKF